MWSIIGTIFGFVSSTIPSLIKVYQDRQDKAHELKVMELQAQLQAQGHTERLEEINTQADISESAALYRAAAYEAVAPVGNKYADLVIGIFNALVNFYNQTVRPTVTYSFFVVYGWIKVTTISYVLPQIKDLATFKAHMPEIWTEADMAIFCTIISFWFGSRAMQKFFKK